MQQYIQMNQINQLNNQMKIPQKQMPVFPMNQINQMQINKMYNNQINQNLMKNQIKTGAPGMPAPKMQPMIPMPIPMNPMNSMNMSMYPIPNPILMQTMYQQDIIRQKELQQLNNDYEYQLMRQKINEQYKIVDDKKDKNN